MTSNKYPKSDSQRAKVYAGEKAAAWDARATELLTHQEAEQYIVKATDWLRSKGLCFTHGKRIQVRHNVGRGGAWANRTHGVIMLTGPAHKRWIILHEVAHLALHRRHPDFDGDLRAHGWVFCDVYLQLVQHFLGVAAATELRRSLKAHGARVRPKRQMTEAQREAAAERLAASRPKRVAGVKHVLRRLNPEGQEIYFHESWNKGVSYIIVKEDGRTWYRSDSNATMIKTKALTRVNVEVLWERAAKARWCKVEELKAEGWEAVPV